MQYVRQLIKSRFYGELEPGTYYRHLISKQTTFKNFKNGPFEYYSSAFVKSYDVDDSRTWKLICMKCNKARILTTSIPCCL